MEDKTYNIWIRLTDGKLDRDYYGVVDNIPPTDDVKLYSFWSSLDDEKTYNDAVSFYRLNPGNTVYQISETGVLSWRLKNN